jgi:Outer membrane protein beta-barrel domain
MRVLSGVVLLLLVTGTPARAQGFTWGLKGGINLATLSSDEEPSPDNQIMVGLVGGGYINWRIGGRLDFQPEVLVGEQGSALGSDLADAKIKLDYVTVPLLVRYRLSSSSGGLAVYGGPSLAVKFRARASAEFGGDTVTTDISDQIETMDYGVAVGAMYETGRYSIDGRYTFGLGNINAQEDNPAKVHNRVITFLVGVRF